MYCRYCDKKAQWVDNKIIYGKSFGKSHKIWYCSNCGAYVGCHNNTKKPLGTIANKQLRLKRIEAHKIIDSYWKGKNEIYYERGEVYKILKEYFGFQVHIGESEIDICDTIIKKHKLIFNK